MPKEKLIALRRLLSRGDSADIIVQSAKETITKKDLRRRLVRKLRGKDVESEHYLSDRIMNAFFNQTAIKGIEQGHTVLCLQSTDLPDIIQRPCAKWDQLLRKRLKNTDLQTVDNILIPANIRNKHWVLVVVDTRARTLALYDSLPQFLKTHTNDNPLQPIKNFLQSHPNFKDIHWTTKDTHWFPQQQNGVDCGLFTCAAALCTIARQEMQFNHHHIQNFRIQLAQWLIDDSTNHSHTTDIPQKTAAISQSSTSPRLRQGSTSSEGKDEEGRGGHGDDGEGRGGERAGYPGSDPEKPKREAQRGCDPHNAEHSPYAPQGVARQERVNNPSTSPKAGAGARPHRSTPKTSSRSKHQEANNNRVSPKPKTAVDRGLGHTPVTN